MVVEPELAGKVGHAVADYLAPVVGQLGLGDLGRDVRAAEKLVEDLAYKQAWCVSLPYLPVADVIEPVCGRSTVERAL